MEINFSRGRTPIETLRYLFLERKQRNLQYTLNAFARDLGLSSCHLSRIMNGTRALTLRQGMQIAAMLGFNQKETNLFVLGIVEAASKNAKISKKLREQIEAAARNESGFSTQSFQTKPFWLDYSLERFKSISQWYHLAILNLTFVRDFESNSVWISERLGITRIEAEEAVCRLLKLGLLVQDEKGKLKKAEASLFIKTERSEPAMKQFHGQMIELAKNELQKSNDEDFKKRQINSITFPFSDSHLENIKKDIVDFQMSLLKKYKQGPFQNVYQLNFQLFPLTAVKNRRRKDAE